MPFLRIFNYLPLIKPLSAMSKISRRYFLHQGGIAAGAAVALSSLPKSMFAQSSVAGIPLGFQSWSVKDDLARDFAGTLKNIAAQGYKLIEMCSPKGYVNAGFGPMAAMKTSDIRSTIEGAGLSCPSCHFGLKELNEDLDDRIAFAREMGMSEMICSSFGLPKTAGLNDYLTASDQLNRAGEKIKAAGMQAGFHNHEIEFSTIDGKLVYDEMLKRLDPELVKMQFQTQVITIGYKAADYFKKYPGRFVSAHLSDWTKDKKEVPVGQGVIDWKEFFAAAKTSGVKHFFVEMEPATFADSAKFISKIALS
jgi:sugar phosphate isomerase/epimerase